ncbi:hypothetical protein ABIB48_003004 [Arthrobacter sp. UYCu511]
MTWWKLPAWPLNVVEQSQSDAKAALLILLLIHPAVPG